MLPSAMDGSSNVLSVNFEQMTYPVTVDGIHTVRHTQLSLRELWFMAVVALLPICVAHLLLLRLLGCLFPRRSAAAHVPTSGDAPSLPRRSAPAV